MIKFREWETERKTMVHMKREDFDDSVSFRGAHEEGGERILMQWTGVPSNNEKEIYEGDVVKGKRWVQGEYKRHIGVVHFVMGKYIVKGVGKYVWINEELNPLYEVIGNIYENPELLQTT